MKVRLLRNFVVDGVRYRPDRNGTIIPDTILIPDRDEAGEIVRDPKTGHAIMHVESMADHLPPNAYILEDDFADEEPAKQEPVSLSQMAGKARKAKTPSNAEKPRSKKASLDL